MEKSTIFARLLSDPYCKESRIYLLCLPYYSSAHDLLAFTDKPPKFAPEPEALLRLLLSPSFSFHLNSEDRAEAKKQLGQVQEDDGGVEKKNQMSDEDLRISFLRTMKTLMHGNNTDTNRPAFSRAQIVDELVANNIEPRLAQVTPSRFLEMGWLCHSSDDDRKYAMTARGRTAKIEFDESLLELFVRLHEGVQANPVSVGSIRYRGVKKMATTSCVQWIKAHTIASQKKAARSALQSLVDEGFLVEGADSVWVTECGRVIVSNRQQERKSIAALTKVVLQSTNTPGKNKKKWSALQRHTMSRAKEHQHLSQKIRLSVNNNERSSMKLKKKTWSHEATDHQHAAAFPGVRQGGLADAPRRASAPDPFERTRSMSDGDITALLPSKPQQKSKRKGSRKGSSKGLQPHHGAESKGSPLLSPRHGVKVTTTAKSTPAVRFNSENHPITENMNFMHLSNVELARQITLMMFELFRQIKPPHLMDQNWSTSIQGSIHPVNAFVEFANDLSLWAASEVLLWIPEYCKERVGVLEKLIGLANQLIELGNFAAGIPLLMGLEMTALSRLKLRPENSSIRDSLYVLADPSKSWLNYRTAVKTFDQVVPHIGVTKQDLVFIEDGNQTFLEDGKVNADKLNLIADVIMDVLKFQDVSYGLEAVPQIQEYWKTGRMVLDEDQLFQQSYKIAKRN